MPGPLPEGVQESLGADRRVFSEMKARASGPRRYLQSLRFRILAIALTPAILGSSVITGYFANRTLAEAESALHSRGREIAAHLANAAEYEHFSGNMVYLKHLLDFSRSGQDILALGIVDDRGHWQVVSGQATLMGNVHGQPGVFKQTLGDYLLFAHPIGALGHGDAAPYLSVETRTPPAASIVVLLDTRPLQQHHGRVLWGSAALLAMILAATGIVAWRMSSGLSGRLQAIADAVERVTLGQEKVRVATPSRGELGKLEQGINRMAAALQEHREGMQRRVAEATAELVQQKQAAEAAVLAKSRFLAAASHDLRQPLHALTLLVAALRERVQGSEVQQLARHIEASALAMQELLNALLDFSKLEAGVVVAHPECFPLNRVLNSVLRQFSPLAADKGLVLHVHSTSAWAYSDPVLVERILMNFVSNAIRYSDAGWVVVGLRREQETLRVEVWDTGKGIPPAYQDKIFEEYFQLDNPERSRDKGLGLGLAIVARMARLVGSPINVFSQPGRGSCFSFRLPRCTPHATPVGQDAPLLPPQASLEHILVAFIDDDESILEAMVALFSQWDIDLAAAMDAVEIERDLRELGRAPDLILSDYRLPGGITGIQAIADLRRAFGEHIPAALVTGDTAPETIQAIAASGLPALHKPLKPANLRAMMVHLLAGRKA